ncbi:hypothetical protein CFP56_039127, partial [Quercus suber]
MAFRGNSYWKSMLIRQLGGNRSFATSTAPKFAPTVDAAHADNSLSSSYWKSMLIRQPGGNRSFATSTAPKFAPTVDAAHADNSLISRVGLKFELAPLYVLLGMVGVGVTIGIHTMKQELMHSPTVRVNKKRRVSLPEVEDPEVIIKNSDNFLQKSFLRKVAHIRDRKP